jgi:hypothetical protein
METIIGIERFPMISFFIFFLFFLLTFIWVIRLDKKYIKNVSALPLDDSQTPIKKEKP